MGAKTKRENEVGNTCKGREELAQGQKCGKEELEKHKGKPQEVGEGGQAAKFPASKHGAGSLAIAPPTRPVQEWFPDSGISWEKRKSRTN